MKAVKPLTAFGAIFLRDHPRVVPWTVKGTAHGVRDEVGRMWCKENPAAGWRAARVEGARVVKVEIRIAGRCR